MAVNRQKKVGRGGTSKQTGTLSQGVGANKFAALDLPCIERDVEKRKMVPKSTTYRHVPSRDKDKGFSNTVSHNGKNVMGNLKSTGSTVMKKSKGVYSSGTKSIGPDAVHGARGGLVHFAHATDMNGASFPATNVLVP